MEALEHAGQQERNFDGSDHFAAPEQLDTRFKIAPFIVFGKESLNTSNLKPLFVTRHRVQKLIK